MKQKMNEKIEYPFKTLFFFCRVFDSVELQRENKLKLTKTESSSKQILVP